ncbi:hypothetical protein PCANB_000676 [Pneumocystis canis]|nr:hypothetical protein PCK1_000662 [Pneumocystis canis]KAG5437639.1 hypothetical protein PCANB_000676 [Pneumocystis canis]
MQPLIEATIAGGLAGLIVDIILFPLDTLKTWRQQKNDFYVINQKINGNSFHKNTPFTYTYQRFNYILRSLYRGLAGMTIGSMPSSLVFFTVYEATQTSIWNYINIGIKDPFNIPLDRSLSNKSKNEFPNEISLLSSTISASLGELAACLIRVPTELVKQRTQAGHYHSSLEALYHILHRRAGGLYTGYISTVIRDVPFSALQFPLWEILKQKMNNWNKSNEETIFSNTSTNFSEKITFSSTPLLSAASGSIAGGISAALTTPLDVVKTRIMLNETKHNWLKCISQIVKEEGAHALFKGFIFRVAWTSIGGALFLGTYDGVRQLIHNLSN